MRRKTDGEKFQHCSTTSLTVPCRLEVLRALIGRIPPNHLWAELLWQRQQELAQHAAMP
jgi:hypothetical protein